jgi:hypothetical protein
MLGVVLGGGEALRKISASKIQKKYFLLGVFNHFFGKERLSNAPTGIQNLDHDIHNKLKNI